jgi:hypothetical protein
MPYFLESPHQWLFKNIWHVPLKKKYGMQKSRGHQKIQSQSNKTPLFVA